MQHWENIWTFKTARFCVAFDVTPCEDDPADLLSFQDDNDAVHNGDVAWFDARVRVLIDHNVIGEDYLSGCAYADIKRDFVQAHWRHHGAGGAQSRPMKDDYFTDMVRSAIADARTTAMRLRDVHGLKAA
jgi:hypothetical protein